MNRWRVTGACRSFVAGWRHQRRLPEMQNNS